MHQSIYDDYKSWSERLREYEGKDWLWNREGKYVKWGSDSNVRPRGDRDGKGHDGDRTIQERV